MIKQFFKDTPNSVWFWNILAVLVFILIWALDEEVALGIYTLINLPVVFFLFMRMSDAKYDKETPIIAYQYWVWLVPITWVLVIVGLALGGLFWVGFTGADKIKEFNKWINKK
jgi:hypothetical protein